MKEKIKKYADCAKRRRELGGKEAYEYFSKFVSENEWFFKAKWTSVVDTAVLYYGVDYEKLYSIVETLEGKTTDAEEKLKKRLEAKARKSAGDCIKCKRMLEPCATEAEKCPYVVALDVLNEMMKEKEYELGK